MYNPMNTTIFDPSESSTCTVIKDLVSYVIRGRNKDNTPKNIFKALVEEDMNHTGYLALEAFERVFNFLEIKIDRFINVFRRRYEDSSQEGRINITSLLYDMYNIKRTSPEILGQFPDFPPKPPVDKDKCLVNLSEILKRKGFQADTFVAKLVEFGKSNRVRIPHILAKVYESCWESFTDRSQPREDRLPLQKVFDIVDCLDTPKIGSMMDHQLSSILNSYFQMEIMLFYRTLLIKLQEQKSDLRAFVTKAMTGNEIVQVERLRSHLLAERFSADSVNKVFKRIGLEGVKEVPLAVLQQKIEKDMLLLGICDKPESTRQYIYGESTYSRESAAEQGVELVIAQMHEGFQASGRDFYTVFNYPTNQLVSRDYFLTTLLKLGVTHHIEREKLIFLCKDKRDPSAISLSTLKAIYDSRFGLGGSNTVSQKQIEMTIKKLRETIRAMGFSVSILFTRADSNQTGSIDRGELFFLLLKLDEGIRKDEANAIFDQIDRDRSGTISQTEFESFFQAEVSSLGGNIRLEKVRWAQHIFGEITVRLEEKGKRLKEMLSNHDDAPEVGLPTFRLMLRDLGVRSYLDDYMNQQRFEQDVCVPGKLDRVDYPFLISCLNLFPPMDRKSDVLEGVLTAFLNAFQKNPKRVAEYLDIETDGKITKAEFSIGGKRHAQQYTDTELHSVFSLIAGSEKATEIKTQYFENYLDNFNKKMNELKAMKEDPTKVSVDHYESATLKIKRFFNFDEGRFYRDLTTYDPTGRVKFGDLLYYLNYNKIQLTKEEESALGTKFNAVSSTILNLEYITAMIFHGRANMAIINLVTQSQPVQKFIQQVKSEMNLMKKGSFDLFNEYDKNADRVVDINELKIVCAQKMIILDSAEITEVFNFIGKGDLKFNLAQFRKALYGKELDNLGNYIYKIMEKCRSENKAPRDYFFRYSDPSLDFQSFSRTVQEIQPSMTYETIDLLFSKIDADNSGRISLEEFGRLIDQYSVLNEFKDYIIQYAQTQNRSPQEIFYTTSVADEMTKEDFRRMVGTITANRMNDMKFEILYKKLDKDGSGSISKVELSEIYDLTQKELFSLKDFVLFQNAVISYCDQIRISLDQLFKNFSVADVMTVDKLQELAKQIFKNSSGQINLTVLTSAIDKDFSGRISKQEFKDAILGTEINPEELINSVKRVVMYNRTNVDDVYLRYDHTRSNKLSFSDFCGFMRSLNINLTFPQIQILFDTINADKDDNISRDELYEVLFTKGSVKLDLLNTIDAFKKRFNEARSVEAVFIKQAGYVQGKVNKPQFVKFAKDIYPEIALVEANLIFEKIDFKSLGALELKEIKTFCDANNYSADSLSNRHSQLTVVMTNLKLLCSTKKKDLASILNSVDRDGQGLVPRDYFIGVLRREGLLDAPEDLNVLANSYTPRYSTLVDCKKLLDDMNIIDIQGNTGYTDIIRRSIIKLAIDNKMTLKDIFQKYSTSNKMSKPQLETLISDSGYKNFNNKWIDSLFSELDRRQAKIISFYQFLSIFDKENIARSLSMVLGNFAHVYIDILNAASREKSTLTGKYGQIPSIIGLAQTIESEKIVNDKRADIKAFTKLFEDVIRPNEVDPAVLKLLEQNLGSEVLMYSPIAGLNQSRVVDSVTGLPFETINRIKKTMMSLDGFVKEHKSDYKTMLKKYDPTNSGLITTTDFDKFLSDDLQIEPKSNNRVTELKDYANSNGYVNYDKLWKIINVDLESRKKEVTFKEEKVVGQNSAVVPQPVAVLPQDPSGQQGNIDKGPAESVLPVLEKILNFTVAPVKQQILGYYYKIPFYREQIIEHLMPGVNEVESTKILNKLHTDIKDIPVKDLEEFLKPITVNRMVNKIKLRDLLFDMGASAIDTRTMSTDQQIEQFFNELDVQNKSTLSSQQVMLGFKYLGLNKSQHEIDVLYNDFKKDNPMMTKADFYRMVKHEFSKDIVKDRVLKERLMPIVARADPWNDNELSNAQIQYIFTQAGAPLTEFELDAVANYCGKTPKYGVEVPRLVRTIVSGTNVFTPEQEQLGNALVKIRSALQLKVGDQYLSFKFMPSNYVSSFTEECYLNTPAHLPTAALRPTLGDGKFYYTNMLPPTIAQETNVYSRYPKFLKLSRNCFMCQISLDKATGVPIPDSSVVSPNEIVAREVRIGLFEENFSTFVANILNLECRWTDQYEDRIYFDTNKIAEEDSILIKLSDSEEVHRKAKYSILFEFVYFVRKNNSTTTVPMSAGYAKLPLIDADKERSISIPLEGGSPFREKGISISPGDVRHKRKGFLPKFTSIFEGTVKSQLHLKTRPIKIASTVPTDYGEEIELLPDTGVFSMSQLKISSCFRQILGREAFTFYGTTTSNINTHLNSETFVNSFCNYFCVPRFAAIISQYWQTTILKGIEKDSYEEKMNKLRRLLDYLYPLLNTATFMFLKNAPHTAYYGEKNIFDLRQSLLKRELDRIWEEMAPNRPNLQNHPVKLHLPVDNIPTPAIEPVQTSFTIQELMEDDFPI